MGPPATDELNSTEAPPSAADSSGCASWHKLKAEATFVERRKVKSCAKKGQAAGVQGCVY